MRKRRESIQVFNSQPQTLHIGTHVQREALVVFYSFIWLVFPRVICVKRHTYANQDFKRKKVFWAGVGVAQMQSWSRIHVTPTSTKSNEFPVQTNDPVLRLRGTQLQGWPCSLAALLLKCRTKGVCRGGGLRVKRQGIKFQYEKASISLPGAFTRLSRAYPVSLIVLVWGLPNPQPQHWRKRLLNA